jgi:hypothetical protein
MTHTPCHYAVLRFRPYAETGEFVNVGLAVVAPEAGEFAFKCDVRRRRRVSQGGLCPNVKCPRHSNWFDLGVAGA